jgi:hypothetical protein
VGVAQVAECLPNIKILSVEGEKKRKEKKKKSITGVIRD